MKAAARVSKESSRIAVFNRVIGMLCRDRKLEIPSPPLWRSCGGQLPGKGLCKNRHIQPDHDPLVALLDGGFGLVPWRPGDDRDAGLLGAVKDLLDAIDDSFVGLREGAQ
jgi:hypothetical protein